MHSFLLTRGGKLSRNHQIAKPFLPYILPGRDGTLFQVILHSTVINTKSTDCFLIDLLKLFESLIISDPPIGTVYTLVVKLLLEFAYCKAHGC